MRLFVFIFLLFLVFGCIRDSRIPKGILPQNEMRKIMWDLMRADAYVSDFIMKDSTCDQKAESAILYERIFSIHSTTEETFRKSVAFYESRPDLLKTIMDSLRSDEKRVQEYQNYGKKPEADTTLRKNRIIKKAQADTTLMKNRIKQEPVK
jgi:hypothetical protein